PGRQPLRGWQQECGGADRRRDLREAGGGRAETDAIERHQSAADRKLLVARDDEPLEATEEVRQVEEVAAEGEGERLDGEAGRPDRRAGRQRRRRRLCGRRGAGARGLAAARGRAGARGGAAGRGRAAARGGTAGRGWVG